ncbi:helix-turn-helix transcriptional regulator [Halarsenatibacter silvermanii]|uniref:Helix-turn-helix n=1 Tax=Halarsenatibacter silvermanii TaxID=321763 RepID=A0A1G9TMJ7_9FIRM|nr:helix-turn-helix transcriptional regulator [Halarsenatibacter silvermanii]SDM48903.1 Helix-turn-helix [Halarsenatibacter silvermanii]
MGDMEIRDMSEAIDVLVEERPELREVFEGEDPVYELRKKILELRLEKGYSQEELAKKAGTKQAVISRIENGESEPRIDTVIRIAKALDKKIKIELV